MNDLVSFLRSLGKKEEHESRRSTVGFPASPGTLLPPHQLHLSRSSVTRGRLQTRTPHLMLWSSSEIGRRRLVTSSLLAARASVESDPVDSHLSSGPAICYESPEGPGP